MQTTTRFALQRHTGAYDSWPVNSRLLVDGQPSAVRVPGYTLLHQYLLPGGHLLVTDFDCPFEQATSFVLLDRQARLVCCRTLCIPYGSYNLERFEWLDDRHAHVGFQGDDRWLLTIHDWGIPILRPRLRLGRIHTSPSTDAPP
jgi:hypothetical protein